MRAARVLVLALLIGAPLAAQERGVRAGAVAYFASLGSASQKGYQSGTWVGLEGQVAKGRLALGVRGLRGTLGGDPVREDRDARQTDAWLTVRIQPWLQIGARGKAVAVSTSLANSVWRMYGAGASFSSAIGTPRLRGWADVAVYPITAVVASQNLGTPRSAEVGLAYRPSSAPVEFRFSYLLQTIDFKGALDQRLGGLLLVVRSAGR